MKNKTANQNKQINWDSITAELFEIFRMTTAEKERFYNSNTAKIIATIPFAAKCREPERTAFAHLVIYISEIRGIQDAFAHTPSDDEDLYNRLAFISTFEGGNTAIIQHGIDMLALIMINGYFYSKKHDLKYGIYNPFNSGAWNYSKIKSELIKKIESIKCPALDVLFDFNNGCW